MTDPAAPSDVTSLWRGLRGLLRREYPVLVLLLLAMVGAEISLRLVRPDMAGQVYDRHRTGGQPIEINAHGLRVPAGTGDISLPRVLGVGDSTTFGTGVAATDTWPLRLAEQISVDVGNAGFEGASLKDFAHRFETIWSDAEQLDTVVLLVTGNMVSFTDFHWESGPRTVRPKPFAPDNGLTTRIKHLVQSSALWKAVTLTMDQGKYAIGLTSHRVDPQRPLSPLMAYGWEQPDLGQDAQPRMWSRFEERLNALKDTLYARDVCLVLAFLPPRFLLSDDPRDNLKFVPKGRLNENAEARVGDMAARLNLPFIPLSPDLAARNTERLYVPADYTHLNAAGHLIAAETIGARLAPILSDEAPCAAR